MVPHLIPGIPELELDAELEPRFQLWQVYDAYVDPPGDEIVWRITYETPLLGLARAVPAGLVTREQFLLHTALIVEGQISNGGMHQLLLNFPAQVEDVGLMLRALGQREFEQAWRQHTDPLRSELLEERNRHPSQLPEAAFDREHPIVDEMLAYWHPDDFMAIDSHFMLVWEAPRRGMLPLGSWSTSMCAAMVDYAKAHPEGFATLG